MMKISQITTYPIKSLAGITQSSATLTHRGLQYDRRWMLVNENGRFLTQREYPQMALFRPTLTEDHLVVFAPHQIDNQIEIPLEGPREQPAKMVQVWGDTVMAITVDSQIDEWFADHLGVHCRLVYMPAESKRPIKEKYGITDGQVSFADSSPILIIGENALADLNTRLEAPLPMDRFRPNLVFTGGIPYEEETWGPFRIGDVPFTPTKACVRCSVTTIDQQTGIVGKEPLRTLAAYKANNQQVTFGLLAAWTPDAEDAPFPTLSVGDAIELGV
jgi:uncharacterized protein YcbX